MKLTNGEIFNAKAPLEKLLVEKFPVKTSYGLAKLANKLNDQLQVIEKVRQGLFQTYGEPDPKNQTQLTMQSAIEERDDEGNVKQDAEGNPITIPNPKFPKFAEELGELFSQGVEIVFDAVTLPEKVAATCDKCNHNMDKALEVKPAILMALEKFIKVE